MTVAINIRLAAMVLLSTLPIGLAQAWASVEVETWYASEVLHTPMLTTLRWMRMFGDTIFAFGAVVLGWFAFGLVTGHSFDQGARVVEEGEYTPHEPELVHQGD
jgi:nitric oxide reductase subunit B